MNLFKQSNTPNTKESLIYLKALSYLFEIIFDILKKRENGNVASFQKEHKIINETIQLLQKLEKKFEYNDINLLCLKKIFELSNFQLYCIIISYIFNTDTLITSNFSSEKVYKNSPLPSLILQSYQEFWDNNFTKTNFIVETNSDFLIKFFGINKINNQSLTLVSQIIAYISGGTEGLEKENKYFSTITPIKSNSPVIDIKLTEHLTKIAKISSVNKNTIAILIGEKYSGRKFHIEQYAAENNKDVIYINLSSIIYDDNAKNIIFMQLMLTNSVLCITDAEDFFLNNKIENIFSFVLNILEIFSSTGKLIILLFQKDLSVPEFIISNFYCIYLETNSINFENNILLWEYASRKINFEKQPDFVTIANKYNFTAGRIINICSDLLLDEKLTNKPISIQAIYDKCNLFIDNILIKKTTHINPSYNLDDIIMTEEQKKLLLHAINYVKLKHIVYDKWKYKKYFPYGRGLNLLFAGPPGTGKTMGAQVIANELKLPLYRLNLSNILSKYIGETEEALREVFDAAEKSNVILFIDEMDALFGKRSEVKSSHEQYANMETSFLLQRIEQYTGIVIMATNYLTNIDDAFIRRIHFIIHFAFPDAKLRLQLWKSMFPKSAPLKDDIDFDFLGEMFEISGGNIKNIALNAAFIAARRNEVISMKFILHALKDELSKQGKILLKEDFGKYSFLID